MRLRIVISLLILGLAACGQAPAQPVAAQAISEVSTTEAQPDCNVMDQCTYVQQGFSKTPKYDCHQITYQRAEHLEIASPDFDGKECLITREDWMHMGMGEVQGPGPKIVL